MVYYLMDKLKVTVEQYDKEHHGPYDDCDYVVICDNHPCTKGFGEEVAEYLCMMNLSNVYGYEEGDKWVYYCCHA